MLYETEAVYEDGVLKLEERLPLEDHQRVKVVVQESSSVPRTAKDGDWWPTLQAILSDQKQRGFVGSATAVDRSDEAYEDRTREILRNTSSGSAGG